MDITLPKDLTIVVSFDEMDGNWIITLNDILYKSVKSKNDLRQALADIFREDTPQ